MEAAQLKVELFGGLKISGMGGSLNMDSLHSSMLTKLLAYILCHKNDKCMVHDLIDALWQEADTDNPAGALKNLMYRLRSVLKKEWPEAELIITGKGFYRWNTDIDTVVDVDLFEAAIKSAAKTTDEQRRIALYEEAISCFSGQFLAGMNEMYWMATLETYYFSAYLSAVKALCALLEKDARFEEMERICKHALNDDPLDGELYYYFIKSLYGQNKSQLAVEQYHKAENILYDNLGVRMPEKAQQLYSIMMAQDHIKASGLGYIMDELHQDMNSGAFYCEYGVFKQVFQLQIRRSERLGISAYLALITIEPSELLLQNPQLYREVLSDAPARLRDVLSASLRSGDVITRYSENQYLALLPTCQYESLKKIRERIRYSFFNGKSKRMYDLKFEFSEIY